MHTTITIEWFVYLKELGPSKQIHEQILGDLLLGLMVNLFWAKICYQKRNCNSIG